MSACPACGGMGFSVLEWEGELKEPGEGQLVCSNCGTIYAEGTPPQQVREEDQVYIQPTAEWEEETG